MRVRDDEKREIIYQDVIASSIMKLGDGVGNDAKFPDAFNLGTVECVCLIRGT